MKALLTIVITAAITSLCWYMATESQRAFDEVWLISAVKTPGRLAFDDISVALNSGDIDTAKAKLQIIQSEWKLFESEDGVGKGIGDIMIQLSQSPDPDGEK